MIKAKFAMLICTLFFCTIALAESDATTSPSAPTLINFDEPKCIGMAGENLPSTNIDIVNHSNVLEFARTQANALCSRLIDLEVNGVFQNQQIFGRVMFNHPELGGIKRHNCVNLDANTSRDIYTYLQTKNKRDHQSNLYPTKVYIDPTQESSYNKTMDQCQVELVPVKAKELNASLNAREKYLADQKQEIDNKRMAEDKALEEKLKAEERLAIAIELAKQTERTFDIKGLNLKLSKQQILSLAGQKFWKCSKYQGDPAIEVCTIEFAQQGCTKAPAVNGLGQPIYTANGMPVMLNKECGVIFPIIDSKQLTSEGKKITTVGGQHILNIEVYLYEGVAYEYKILVGGNSPELESGLQEKFGSPTIKTASQSKWLSKEETFEYASGEATIHSFNVGILNAAEKHHTKYISDRNISEQNEAQRKSRNISDQKKKDI